MQDEPIDDIEFVDTDAMGDELQDKSKLKTIRENLAQSQSEAKEHLTALQRSRADYVNLKRELDEVRDTTKTKTIERVVGDFLPILDSFDMAMGNADAWNAVDKNWRMGIEHIYSQFKNVLGEYGILAIDQVDVDFDHNIHESMETLETDDADQDHKIAKIIQKGYKMGDRIIRPARVVVWKVK